MGYMHLPNLYKDMRILEHRECYALEKVHGTSAHIAWRGGELHFYGGGERADVFAALFDHDELRAAFTYMGLDNVIVYGEAYGGKQQKQAWRYGDRLRFVVFDVRIGETWLNVPEAYGWTVVLNLRFVDWVRVPTGLAHLDAQRDAPSTEAKRNGVAGDQPREGVVLRPITETMLDNGTRLIAKHKRDEERETRTTRNVGARLETLAAAEAITAEWVTPTRLEHVLQRFAPDVGVESTGDVIRAMIEDVMREGEGEVVDSREARAAIGRATAGLFKRVLRERLEDAHGADKAAE